MISDNKRTNTTNYQEKLKNYSIGDACKLNKSQGQMDMILTLCTNENFQALFEF